MRILHILANAENARTEAYATDLILGLHETGIYQRVVMNLRAPHAAELKKAGVKIKPRVLRAPWLSWQRFWLRRLIAKSRPDAIQCWTRDAVVLASGIKIPVVGWLAGSAMKARPSSAIHLVGANQNAVARLAKNDAPKSCVRFIPVFSVLSQARAVDRNTLATPRDAKVLLSLARLHPDSRLDILLAALGKLPDCIAWLVGSGPLRHELERRAYDLGVIDRVRFVGEGLDRAALLRAADLCVLSAEDQPLGTIAQEAWAAGTPLVAVHSIALKDSGSDVDGCLFTPAGDEAAFAYAIRRVLDEEDLRRRLVADGYAVHLKTYARDAVIRQWITLYRELAASG